MRRVEQFWLAANNVNLIMETIHTKRLSKKANNKLIENKLDILFPISQNLNILQRTLINTEIKELIENIFMDMYKYDFIKLSSVNSDFVMVTTHNLELLKKINLLQHTFNVINEINEIISTTYGLATDFFILAALVHDFGKCNNIAQDFFIDAKDNKHHKISSIYLKIKSHKLKLSKFNRKFLEATIKAINIHHDDVVIFEEHEKDMETMSLKILDVLKKADVLSREKEMDQ